MHTSTSPKAGTQHEEPLQSVGETPSSLPCLLLSTEDAVSEAALQLPLPQHCGPSQAPQLTALFPTKTLQPPALSPPPQLHTYPQLLPVGQGLLLCSDTSFPEYCCSPGRWLGRSVARSFRAMTTGAALTPCTPQTPSIPEAPAQTLPIACTLRGHLLEQSVPPTTPP